MKTPSGAAGCCGDLGPVSEEQSCSYLCRWLWDEPRPPFPGRKSPAQESAFPTPFFCSHPRVLMSGTCQLHCLEQRAATTPCAGEVTVPILHPTPLSQPSGLHPIALPHSKGVQRLLPHPVGLWLPRLAPDPLLSLLGPNSGAPGCGCHEHRAALQNWVCGE